MKKQKIEKVISKTRRPVTQEDIETGIKELGIKKGDIVLLHCALSSFGFIIGREIVLVRAILNVIGDSGTIVVPAQSVDNSDPEFWENPPVPEEWWDLIRKHSPAYDKNMYSCYGMGSVVNQVMQLKKAIRSEHPCVSFVAYGAKAKKVCAKHDLQPKFGRKTPLGYLYDNDCKVLLLGVGYSKSTCFHLAEVLSNRLPTTKESCMVSQNGRNNWISFIDFNYDTDDFDDLGFEMEKEKEVKKTVIGTADCKMFSLKEGVDFATRWIIKNRSY